MSKINKRDRGKGGRTITILRDDGLSFYLSHLDTVGDFEIGDIINAGQQVGTLKKVCPFPFMYLHINSDGSVAGCTLDWARKVLVGDRKVNDLYEIWNGNGMKELRLQMLRGERDKIPMCDTCNAPNVCVIDNLDPFMEELIPKFT